MALVKPIRVCGAKPISYPWWYTPDRADHSDPRPGLSICAESNI